MSKESPSARITRCPTCGKGVRYDVSNPDRPFCGARCKTNDIARWAEESYRIPIEGQPTGDDEIADADAEES